MGESPAILIALIVVLVRAREVDLATLAFFDHPTAPFCQTSSMLEPDHKECRRISKLWAALVHVRLFGGAYRSVTEQLLAKAGV